MRAAAFAAALCLVLCPPAFPEDDDLEPDDPPSGAEPVEELPQFRTEEALEKFKQGVERFEAEEWEEAEQHFREAMRSVEDECRAVVQGWADASECGTRLLKLEPAIRKGEWRAAWNSLNELEKKYGRTRIRPALDAARLRIEAGLYSYLATFERDNTPAGNQMSPGAEHNTEPKYVKRGTGSAKWSSGIGDGHPTLTFAVVGGDRLSSFPRLNLWVYATPGADGQFLLVLDRGSR